MKNFIISFLLVAGIAIQINEQSIIVSYKTGDFTSYSTVSRDMSVCTPQIGQEVFFYKDYKIVQCGGQ